MSIIRTFIAAVSVAACILAGPLARAQEFNFDILDSIPIQEDGRTKPLQTFAGESFKQITGKWKYEKRAPVNNLLLLMSDQSWSDDDIVKVGYIPLKEALGLDLNKSHFAVNDLVQNTQFQSLAREIQTKHSAGEDLNKLENEMARLMHQINTFDMLVTGESLTIVPPPPGSEPEEKWLSVAAPVGYPADTQSKITDTFRGLITAFHHGNVSEFEQKSESLKTLLAQLNTDSEIYPPAIQIERELFYNESRPFLYSWLVYLLSFFLFLLSFFFTKNKPLYWSAVLLSTVGFLYHGYGLVLRGLIAGRPPVSNMYETVVFVSWGILLFALAFEFIYRRRWYMTVGSFVGAGMLILADILPFDPNIEPLVPVLRSNYWLIIHVLTITISYSAFALAMGLAHVSLFFYFYKPEKKQVLRELSLFLYRVIQVGVVLLAAGTILGGVWAAESWGRFWGWDPKETWALISLLGYLAILHARYSGWLHDFGTAIGAILGFFLILMTWYGVNFVLGTGLHSYGFGSGGGMYVMAYVIAELAFLAAVTIKYKFGTPPSMKVEGSDAPAAS